MQPDGSDIARTVRWTVDNFCRVPDWSYPQGKPER
jgi:hypothetical protein